jgi:hypothetical protein
MKRFASHVHAPEVLENGGEKEKSGHSTHSAEPEAEAYVLAAQPEQEDEAVSLAKVPMAHFVHADDSGIELNFPTSHAVHSLFPVAFEYTPTPHTEHRSEPLADANFPAVHRTHVLALVRA